MEFKTKPYPFQYETWERSRDAFYYALFLSPGLGKSKIIIDTAMYLYQQEKIYLLIIIAPKGLYENWNGEIKTHLGDISTNTVIWKSLQNLKLKIKLKGLMGSKFGIYNLDIFLGNIDMLSTKKGVLYLQELLKQHGKNCLFVLDESTAIGNPKSIRTRTAIRLGQMAQYKRILTGTPIADSILELPTQIQFLGNLQDLLKTKNWYSFRNYYCELQPAAFAGRNFVKIIGTRHVDKLKALLKPYSTILSKKEANLQLPEKIYQIYNVELTKEQIQLYRDMKNKSKLELSNVKTPLGPDVTALNVLSKIMKLREILAGFIYDEKESIKIPHKRIDALHELINLNSGKIIIWSNFVHCINEICAFLEKNYGNQSYVKYDGSSTNRDSLVNTFSNSDYCRFFVGNQSIGGYGLTLVASSTMIYYTNDYSFKTRLQSEDRIHRIGQNKSVLYIDMQVQGTIDSRILDILKNKNKLYESIMNNGLLLRDMLDEDEV